VSFAAAFFLVGLSGVALVTRSGMEGDRFQALSSVLVGVAAIGIAGVGWHARSENAAGAAAVVWIADLQAAAAQVKAPSVPMREAATSGRKSDHSAPGGQLSDGGRRIELDTTEAVADLGSRLRLADVEATVASLVRAGRPGEAIALRDAAATVAEALREVSDAVKGGNPSPAQRDGST
jgi:hypothetical protein